VPNVVIIGAGVGGLCLAQGLKQAGLPVRVYERTRRPTRACRATAVLAG